MKLFTLAFGTLSVITTVVAAALSQRHDLAALVNRAARQGLCETVPIPSSGTYPAVCDIASAGAECQACDFQRASHNICGCYDNTTDCNAMLASAVSSISIFLHLNYSTFAGLLTLSCY